MVKWADRSLDHSTGLIHKSLRGKKSWLRSRERTKERRRARRAAFPKIPRFDEIGLDLWFRRVNQILEPAIKEVVEEVIKPIPVVKRSLVKRLLNRVVSSLTKFTLGG